MILILVVILLIACYRTTEAAEEGGNVIICQNEDDFYRLLYNICIQASPCRMLYHLYPLTQQNENQIIDTPERNAFIDYRNERDYNLFRHQLSRTLIFRINGTLVELERRLILQGLVPEAWLPTTIVRIGGDQVSPCYNTTIEVSDIISALYSLHLYKLVVADEFFCHDPNERLLLDPLSNATFCKCKLGKSCNNESFFAYLMTRLSVIIIFGIAATVLTLYVGFFYTHYLLNNA